MKASKERDILQPKSEALFWGHMLSEAPEECKPFRVQVDRFRQKMFSFLPVSLSGSRLPTG